MKKIRLLTVIVFLPFAVLTSCSKQESAFIEEEALTTRAACNDPRCSCRLATPEFKITGEPFITNLKVGQSTQYYISAILSNTPVWNFPFRAEWSSSSDCTITEEPFHGALLLAQEVVSVKFNTTGTKYLYARIYMEGVCIPDRYVTDLSIQINVSNGGGGTGPIDPPIITPPFEPDTMM